ncbi:hypothetical protein HYW42_05640 [Candidatus Daviesbacteria bacterium]|nr:hypothetical protein [Candidatus Daviesbacteria bacterium]
MIDISSKKTKQFKVKEIQRLLFDAEMKKETLRRRYAAQLLGISQSLVMALQEVVNWQPKEAECPLKDEVWL